MERSVGLNNAQLGVLKLLSTLKSDEEVNELKQVISTYYAQKSTAEMDALWEKGLWSEQKNQDVLKEHLRTPYK
ncbi:MAG: hypothetical protein IJ139_04040 [Bacteroidaceae bacterium]|nr:hypothetical protein [Bacteroidaceae bacterium]